MQGDAGQKDYRYFVVIVVAALMLVHMLLTSSTKPPLGSTAMPGGVLVLEGEGLVLVQENSPRVQSQPSPEVLTRAGVSQLFFSPISINHASRDLLTTLPGIGPKMAERIIQDRAENGPLKNLEEITRIHGFGVKKMQRLSELVVVLEN